MVVRRRHRHHLLGADRGADGPEAGRVADRAGGDDRALPVHQARHGRDRPDAAGVGERDVGALEVVRGQLVVARLRDQHAERVEELREREAAGVLDHRHHQRAAAALLLDVHGDAEVHRAVVDHVRLAVDLGEVRRHDRHLLGRRARDRVRDQVREGDLLAGALELLAVAVERGDGEGAERGRGRDLPRLVHVAGEHRARALEQGLLAAGRSRGGAWPARRRRSTRTRARRPCRCGRSGRCPVTLLRSTPCAAATRCATGVTFRPSGVSIVSVSASPAGRTSVASGFGAALAGAAPLPDLHARDDLADGHGVAGLGEQLRDRAGSWRGDLGVHLVGGDLDERLVLGDAVADGLRPLEDRALGDRLAHRGHLDLDDGSRRRRRRRAGCRPRPRRHRPRAPAPEPFSPGAISASTLPTPTVSPSAAWILTTVPETGAGTSASTLSVEISTSVSSSETSSPSCLCHSRMEPSETESPIGGMTTSTVVFTAISRS